MRLRLAGLLAAGGAMVALAFVPPLPAQARTGAGSAAPVCMAREAANGSTLKVMVTPDDVEGMQTRGFKRVSCEGKFATRAQHIQYQNEVCTFVAISNEALQDQFEALHNVRPNMLCAMAEQVAGQWERRSKVAAQAQGR